MSTENDVRELRRLAANTDPADDPAYTLLHRVADRLDTSTVEVEFDRSYTLHDGGTVEYYTCGDVTMEVVYDKNGVLDLDSDANLQYAKRAAKSWDAWAAFIENGGLNK